VSFVTFAANPEAQILSVKDASFAPLIAAVEMAKIRLHNNYIGKISCH
jgi:hypothetical protein